MSLAAIFLLAALVLFLAAALGGAGWPTLKRHHLVAGGLACYVASLLVAGL